MMQSQEMGMVEAQMNSNEKSVNRGVQTEQMHKEKQVMVEKSYNQREGETDRLLWFLLLLVSAVF